MAVGIALAQKRASTSAPMVRKENVIGLLLAGVGASEVVACGDDVLPAERCEVGEKFIRHQVATVAHNVEGAA
jgi:hypothetical protein